MSLTTNPDSKSRHHPTSSMKRRARVISKLVLGFGIFASIVFALSIVLEGDASAENIFYLIFYALLTLLGYKLMRFNLTALRVLRLLAWINVILGGLMLLMTLSFLPATLQLMGILAFDSVLGLILLLSFLVMQVSPVISLLILIATNPPEFRKLFRS